MVFSKSCYRGGDERGVGGREEELETSDLINSEKEFSRNDKAVIVL